MKFICTISINHSGQGYTLTLKSNGIYDDDTVKKALAFMDWEGDEIISISFRSIESMSNLDSLVKHTS